MSKDGDYIHYACDRPNTAHSEGTRPEAYVKAGSKEENDWHTVNYKDIYGVERTYYLCEECYGKYKSMIEKFDGDFMAFIGGGQN